MRIEPPTAEEVASLLDKHADRHPAKRTIKLDGGVRLPVLLGSPIVAPGKGRVWSEYFAALLRLRPEGALAVAFAEECVLWPPRPLWAEWCRRWPGLPAVVARAVREQVAASGEALLEPGEVEPPASILAVSSAPGGWWIVAPAPAVRYAVALSAPSYAVWRLFLEAVNRPTADVWPAVRDLLLGLVAVVEPLADGPPLTAEALLERWPGLAIGLFAAAAQLAGASAEVEEGEW